MILIIDFIFVWSESPQTFLDDWCNIRVLRPHNIESMKDGKGEKEIGKEEGIESSGSPTYLEPLLLYATTGEVRLAPGGGGLKAKFEVSTGNELRKGNYSTL